MMERSTKSMNPRGRQLLAAERHLELAAPQPRLRQEAEVQIRVLQAHALGEVRLDLEVDPPAGASGEIQTCPPHQEAVGELAAGQRARIVVDGVMVELDAAASSRRKSPLADARNGSSFSTPATTGDTWGASAAGGGPLGAGGACVRAGPGADGGPRQA
jgi:hypothetical protein